MLAKPTTKSQVSKPGPSCSSREARPLARPRSQQPPPAARAPTPDTTAQPWKHRFQSASLAALAACTLIASPVVVSPALATDAAQVGTCVLQNCQAALAGCLADAKCLENLVCLQTCNGRPDETECQIRCGDLYQDKAVDVFNTCAVSEKKCVPQRVDEGERATCKLTH